jgi:ribonuclease HII
LEVSPPPQPTLPKTDDIDLNIDMASILTKVNVPVPLSIDIVFFLNTYNKITIATSWSVAPIETTSELIPLNVALAKSKTDDIDININMASILAKDNVHVPLSIDIVFFF